MQGQRHALGPPEPLGPVQLLLGEALPQAVEGGQHWLLVRRDGETYLCPVVIVRQAEQPRHTTRRTKT